MCRPRYRLIPHLLVLTMLLTACTAGPRPGAPAAAPDAPAAEPGPAAIAGPPLQPWHIDPAGVAWIRLSLARPGGPSPRPLYPHRPADQELISRVLGWLAESEPVHGSTAEPSRRGPLLQIRLTGGETVAIAAGYQIHREERPDSTVITGTPAEGQVMLDAPGRREVLRSPLLRRFIETDWHQYLPPEPELAVEPDVVITGETFTVTGGGGAWVEGQSAAIFLVGPGPSACCDPDAYPNGQSVPLGIVPVVDGAFAFTGQLAAEMGPTPGGGRLRLEPGTHALQVTVKGAGGRTLPITVAAGP